MRKGACKGNETSHKLVSCFNVSCGGDAVQPETELTEGKAESAEDK